MSQRRRDAATATVGLGGVAASGALRHSALESAYAGGKRPRLYQERKFLTRAKVPGRKRYATAAALSLVSIPPAAVGTSRLMRRESAAKADDRKHSFLGEGLAGAKESFTARNKTIAQKPPARLVAGNYLAGAAIGSAAGGLTHLGLGRTRLPGAARAAAASASGILAGSASLPLQSRATQRASHGKYEVTPTGVRRRRTKAVRPSQGANVVEGRPGKATLSGHALREQMVGKAIRVKVTGAKPLGWREKIAQYGNPKPRVSREEIEAAYRQAGFKNSAGRPRHLGREELTEAHWDTAPQTGSVAIGTAAVGRGPREYRVSKADPGAAMSRGERRARVTASGVPIPVVGDVAQATTAAALSPEKYRRRTAAQNFTASQGGTLAGQAAGVSGALALAHHSPGFNRRAQSASDAIDRSKANVRAKVGLRPATGPSLVVRTSAASPRVSHAVERVLASRAGRAVARNPKVAAVGGLVGGAIGGTTAQQTTYNHIMTRDDRYRRQHNQSARRGTKVGKADSTGSGMSRRQELEQIRRKQRAAVIGAGTSIGSVGSLGLLGAAALPRVSHAARGKLVRSSLVAGTASGGVSALNGLEGAHLQRKDLRAREKALLAKGLRPTGFRRPSMKAGFIRQTRSPNGMVRTSSVRGGLSKVDTTMSEHQARHLASQYDTRGPLPKHLDRNQRMAAYEARYIASGGKKADKWKHRASRAETGRNIGLAGATAAGAGMLMHKAPGLRRVRPHAFERAAVASGVLGGASELYGEHARSRRASYQNSPAGVAASALSRMRAYTPGGQ